MLEKPWRNALGSGAALESLVRARKVWPGFDIRCAGVQRVDQRLRSLHVLEENTQAENGEQRFFMRFELGKRINSLSQLLHQQCANAIDFKLLIRNQPVSDYPFFWMH